MDGRLRVGLMFIQDKEAQKILSKASVLSNTDDISGIIFASMAI